ncbi:hypothetical protein ACQ86G_11605 [Roseateles chitinivorans]|uniref:hypothetical protein n=1 Tax=Roseateles chitinivorans TaxID=2917965 RepID=UPI003D665AF7
MSTQRHLRRARLMARGSVALFVVSLIATIASTRTAWAWIVPFLMWNHVALVVFAGTAMWTIKRLDAAPAGRASPRLGELLAPWVLAAAATGAVVAVPSWGPSPWASVQTRDGTPVTRHQWHAEGTRYFERVNDGPAVEIDEATYDRLNQRLYGVFSRLWVLFSLVSVVVWRFIALRRKDLLEGLAAPPPPPAVSPALPALPASPASASPGAVAPAGRGSTALIVVIWVGLLGANLLALSAQSERLFCSTPMPVPREATVFLLVMPALFFSIGAFWTTRSPFLSPWIAELIDQRLGAGGSQAFLARLKPLLLMAVASLVGSAHLAMRCWHSNPDAFNGSVPGFFASASIGFALSHVILRWRGVPGV